MKKLLLAVTVFFCTWAVNAQCSFQYGANEEDSIACLGNVTAFNMHFKAQHWEDAYSAWQKVVNNCPCAWSGMYQNAPKMLQAMIKAEKDSARRERLIDTLLWTYDIYPASFPKNFSKGQGIGYQAYYTMMYRNKDMAKVEEAFDNCIRSVEMEKAATQPVVWDCYFRLATQFVIVRKDTNIVIDAYERATEYIDEAIINAWKKYEEDLPQFEVLQKKFDNGEIDKIVYDKEVKKLNQDTTRQMALVRNYEKTIGKIEAMFVPYAECDILEKVYSSKVEANKNDIPALMKIVGTMHKRGCHSSETFRKALEIVHKAQPSAETAYMMGVLSISQLNDYDQAANYITEAISLFPTNEQKVEPYYLLGTINLKKGNYSAAREMAYNALKIRPNYGKAYILIGDLYAASAGRCNSDDPNVVPGAVYWAAADKYAKAAAVDASVAADANAKRARLPKVPIEETFKRGLSAGQAYHVGCWINENTTVR
ncbi:MAG: hypothetical protein J6Y35_05495 [Bacteroidales bacterium]|nr:hypothetical protein [Bacteroidales bacterium]